jgi:protein SCO1
MHPTLHAPWKAQEPVLREQRRQRLMPNVPLLDHNGRALRFYDHIMKDRKVLLNVMYTVCSNICSPATRNLMEARELLGPLARDLHFVSLTLTPLSDPPQALREFKQRHGIGEGWVFLTGLPQNVEPVLRAQGFVDPDADEGEGLLNHSGMARLSDERQMRWTHLNAMLEPRSIARMIRFALS